MSKNVNTVKIPDDFDTYKIIRAFNERLRVARKQFGDDSVIVEKMIERAKMVSDLEWTKSGLNIKKGKENVGRIVTVYQQKLVVKYIKQTTVESIITTMIDPETLQELNKLKGKERYKKLESTVSRISSRKELLTTLWGDVYKLTHDAETATITYDEVKSGAYDDAVEQYLNNEITLQDLVNICVSGFDKKVDDIFKDFSFDENDYNNNDTNF